MDKKPVIEPLVPRPGTEPLTDSVAAVTSAPPAPQPLSEETSGLSRPKKRTKKALILVGLSLLGLLIAVLVSAWIWYNNQMQPRGSDASQLVVVTIESGTSPSAIGTLLEDKSVIRSSTAFDIYTRLSNTRDKLQAGTYRLSPAESLSEIVDHLVNGRVDTFNITFLPGGTLAQHRKVLISAGYSAQEVDAALGARYESPVLSSRPAGMDLEGYIYGETYAFGAGASVQQIIQAALDEYSRVVAENNLIARLQDRGLTLHEGITLASIIQREVITEADKKQAAQIFYLRLAQGMVLGSDVTYQYIADKLGVARDVNLDSPYNTRRYPGLPPGPIASPGLGALIATVEPAAGDYVYFLSGDDDVTYFARTYAEHEANIRNHCAVKCSTL